MEALCNHKWCVSLFLLDGKRKDDEIREVERRETTEESILEKFLPTQNSSGNQLKKKRRAWASVFPVPCNPDPHSPRQRSLLPTRQKPFINVRQILFIADFPADSCEKGTMKINESR